MALSMDEQRILDGMERKLADEDPRLATRLAAFGQPRLPALLGSGKARAAFVLISLALAAMVALMVYSMRPYPAGQDKGHAPATGTSHSTSTRSTPSPGQSHKSPAAGKAASPST
jgi:Protein of unknown function (DUF3040)